jgi:hypothetical protein
MFVGKNFLPQDDQSQYNVLIRTPEGTLSPLPPTWPSASRRKFADCPAWRTP